VCWYVSLLRYASKHFRPYAYRGVSAAVVLGSMVRAVIGVVQRRSLRPISVYAKVARIAGLCMISGASANRNVRAVTAGEQDEDSSYNHEE